MQYSSDAVADAMEHGDAQEAYNDKRERVTPFAIAEICGADVEATAEVLGDYFCRLSGEREPLRVAGALRGFMSDAELVSMMFSPAAVDSLVAGAARELRARYLASAYASKVVESSVDRLVEAL